MNIIIFFRYLSHILFRLLIWCLITSNFQINNLIIGIILSVLIPRGKMPNLNFNFMFKELLKTLISLPKAVQESFYLIFLKNKKELFIKQKSVVSKKENQFINFLDLFRITLTPLTILILPTSEKAEFPPCSTARS